MSYEDKSAPVKKIKVDWLKECIFGALLSAGFTILAMGTNIDGIKALDFAAGFHDFIIIGGMTMTMLCAFSAAIIAFYRSFSGGDKDGSSLFLRKGFKLFPLGNVPALKFMKIFLP